MAYIIVFISGRCRLDRRSALIYNKKDAGIAYVIPASFVKNGENHTFFTKKVNNMHIKFCQIY